MQTRIWFCALAFLGTSLQPVFAAFSYSSAGSTYSQNFDSLDSSGVERPWVNDGTLKGWELYRVTGGANPTPYPVDRYDVSDGSASDGRFYSFGTSVDRALGAVGHATFGYPGDRATSVLPNSTAGWIAASFTNSTGAALSWFSINFDGEQWGDAGNNEIDQPPFAQVMQLQYGFGPSFASVSTWLTPGGMFDFTSPVFTAINQPIDGNGIGRVANLGGTIADLVWGDGEVLWFRWAEKNDFMFDHAMGIDNVSFTAGVNSVSAVPEANSAIIYGVVCVLFTAVWGVHKLLKLVFTEGEYLNNVAG